MLTVAIKTSLIASDIMNVLVTVLSRRSAITAATIRPLPPSLRTLRSSHTCPSSSHLRRVPEPRTVTRTLFYNFCTFFVFQRRIKFVQYINMYLISNSLASFFIIVSGSLLSSPRTTVVQHPIAVTRLLISSIRRIFRYIIHSYQQVLDLEELTIIAIINIIYI